jgi:predicted ferric reductase
MEGSQAFFRGAVNAKSDSFVANPGAPIDYLRLEVRSPAVTPEGDAVADLSSSPRRTPRPTPARSVVADPLLAYAAACSFTPGEYQTLVAKHAEVCRAANEAGGVVRCGKHGEKAPLSAVLVAFRTKPDSAAGRVLAHLFTKAALTKSGTGSSGGVVLSTMRRSSLVQSGVDIEIGLQTWLAGIALLTNRRATTEPDRAAQLTNSSTEKARLAFVMMDRDNDGTLSRADFDAALAESLDANGLVVPPATTAATIDALFGGDADSALGFEQFCTLLAETPRIDVGALGFTKIKWLPQQIKAKPTMPLWSPSPREEQQSMRELERPTVRSRGRASLGERLDALHAVSAEFHAGTSRRARLARWWARHKPGLIVASIYYIVLATSFGLTVLGYYRRSRVWAFFGPAVGISRGSACVLRINCALLLMLMCRAFVTWGARSPLNKWIPFEHHVAWHRHIGYMMVPELVIHVGGHVSNFNRMANGDVYELNAALGLDPPLPSSPTLHWLWLQSIPGSTGLLLLLIMVVMYCGAALRRRHFNVFWSTHHLFIAFYVLLILHGTSGWLEPVSVHYYMILPMALYAAQRFDRCWRSRSLNVCEVIEARAEPSGVLALVFMKPKSLRRFKAGSYVFLNVPVLSHYEWHPFTLTSAPERDYLSLHIRNAGDWTGRLHELCALANVPKDGGSTNTALTEAAMPAVVVDGPFGTPSEGYLHYPVAVLVGAGIGVTPFASILDQLLLMLRAETMSPTPSSRSRCRRVYFFWISRDQHSFEWFKARLLELEACLREKSIKLLFGEFLKMQVFVTGVFDSSDIRAIALHLLMNKSVDIANETGKPYVDPLTGLSTPTAFGRPDWTTIFKQIRTDCPRDNVGVFFCGPRPLGAALQHQCSSMNEDRLPGHETTFHFHTENF